MQLSPDNNRRRGITLLEVLVIIIVLGILASMLLPANGGGRTKANRAKCQNNLRQIGFAFKAYAEDHGGVLPFQATNGPAYHNERFTWVHFQAIAKELGTPRVLTCPADRERRFSTDNFHLGEAATPTSLVTRGDKSISYFLALPDDQARPQDILAGDRNLAPETTLPAYSSHAAGRAIHVPITSGWSVHKSNYLHQQFGNVLLADGSSLGTRDDSLRKLLKAAANSNSCYSIRFIFPQ